MQSTKANKPFGRQPESIHIDFSGDLRDVDAYMQKIKRFIEGQGDNTQLMRNQMKIYPRAVND